MDYVLPSPAKFNVIPGDKSALATWRDVPGAAGYILKYYKTENPEKCIKVRYAQNNKKNILGFRNGEDYFATVAAFLYENGVEVEGEPSEACYFTPISRVLTAESIFCLSVDETAQIHWEYQNKIPNVIFRSEDNSIATVSEDGLVHAHKKGSTGIILTMDNKQSHRVAIEVDRKIDRTKDKHISIMLTGDLMCSAATQKACKDTGYDFSNIFTPEIKELFSSADYVAGVLETMCDDSKPYESEMYRLPSGSANNNSPSTFLKAIKDAGFHGIFTANNHNCDCGLEGLKQTRQHAFRAGLNHIGSLGDNPIIRKIQGITVAFISMSMVSNGLDYISSNPYEELGRFSEKYYLDLVKKAQEKNAEIIIVMMHWGTMNSSVISDDQLLASQFLADNGADIIVGSEPHVLQGFEQIITADGRQVPCIYSLGNFYSAMNELYENTVGTIAKIDISVTPESLGCQMKLLPTMCVRNNGLVQVMPVTPLASNAHEKAFELFNNVYPEELVNGTAHNRILVQTSDVLEPLIPQLPYEIYQVESALDENFKQYAYGCNYYLFDLFHYGSVENWKEELQKEAVVIKESYENNHIILIRLKFPNIGAKRNQLRNLPDISLQNEHLKEIEAEAIRLLNPIVIDISQYYFMDLVNENSFVFENSFYKHCSNLIREIYNCKKHTFYYNDIDSKIWLDRVVMYYQNMTARGFQPYLLNKRADSDLLIQYSSAAFVSKYQKELLQFKAANGSLSHIETFFEDNKFSTDLIRAARAISLILKKDLSQEYNDYSIVFEEAFNIRKELSDLLEEITGLHVVPENVEHIFKLKDQPDKLANYAFAHPVIDIDMWGSSVSKMISKKKSLNLHVQNYIFKQPQVFIDEEPIKGVLLSADPSDYGSHEWRMDAIKGSFTHDGRKRLENSTSDWIVVDLYDLICNMCSYNGQLFEVDDYIKKTPFFKSIKMNCKPTYLFRELDVANIRKGIIAFTKFLKNKYKKNIILIRADLKKEYLTLDGELSPLPIKNNIYEAKVKCLTDAEESFIRMTDCYVINISKNYYASDRFPLGGAHMIHYEDDFYTEASECLMKILNGDSKKVYE